MTEDEWPAEVREVVERYPDAEVTVKAFPEGFPHDKSFVAVAGFIRDRDGNVLLVKHRPGTQWLDRWATPGGVVLGGESPEEALRREVQEECGVEMGTPVLRRIVVMEDASGGRPRTSFTMIFEALAKGEDAPRTRPRDPVAHARWFTYLPRDMHFSEEYEDLI